MTLRILEKWFNTAPWPNAEYIVAAGGQRFWAFWLRRFERAYEFHVRYRGKWVAVVNTLVEPDGTLTLADIVVFERHRLRQQGLGTAMMEEVKRWARRHHLRRIWGFIMPHDGSTVEYLVGWYRKQGFQVYAAKPGKYQIQMKLD